MGTRKCAYLLTVTYDMHGNLHTPVREVSLPGGQELTFPFKYVYFLHM